MQPGDIWSGKTFGGRIVRGVLTPASWLYAAGWQSYVAIYRANLKRAAHPHSPIVCVGNLLVGGAGESPLTLHLVDVLRRMGREVVVGASGYGSPRAEAASVAPEGPLDPREWGDEPAMMRLLIPDLPLVVGRRRVLAAEMCHRRWPDSVLLMDDGFQHLPLEKDLTIVLDPAKPDNVRCLPAGPYREPRSNRGRADLVIPGEFSIVSEPTVFTDARGDEIKLTSGFVLCALARPIGFVEAVRASGVDVMGERLVPDHDPLDAGTLLDGIPSDVPVIVTVKDWVKLALRSDSANRQFAIARHSVRVEKSGPFQEWLRDRLDG